jgi:iron complex transport system substrate-binding protein
LRGTGPHDDVRGDARAVAIVLFGAVIGAHAALEVVDDTGATVRLAAPASRIVSLAPHATELLYAAGAGDRVVGVLATSDWPPEALAKPKVGDSRALDLERILLLKPDLVVTWPFAAPAQVGAADRARHSRVRRQSRDHRRDRGGHGAPSVRSPERPAPRCPRAAEFRAKLARLTGRARRHEDGARVLRDLGRSALHRGRPASHLAGARRLRGRECFRGPPAARAGRERRSGARGEARRDHCRRGWRGAAAWLDDWKRWPTLPAVVHGNLFTVDANLLHRAGPRFIDGMETLCAAVAKARAAAR